MGRRGAAEAVEYGLVDLDVDIEERRAEFALWIIDVRLEGVELEGEEELVLFVRKRLKKDMLVSEVEERED